jgi:hypothetical protein
VSDPQPRPRHTALAGGLVIGASVGVVIGVGEQLAGLYSLDTRETVTEVLSQPPASDLGLDVSGALAMLRVLLMVLAGLATAAAVLGFHALRGSTRARLGLAVLAAPIFVIGLVTGGFLTSLVAAGATLMWVGPSALWFRGEPIPETAGPAPRPRPAERRDERPPAGSHAVGTTLQATRTDTAPYAGRPAARRPDALVWACVLTWAFCSLTVLGMAVSVVLMAANPDLVLEELRRQETGFGSEDASTLAQTTYVTGAVVSVWSLAAAVLAAAAFRGARWGRTGLLVSAAAAGVACLLGVLVSPLLVVPAAATLATVVLLTRPEVRSGFTGPTGPRDPMRS